MALTLKPYALTTVANVKSTLKITSTSWDDDITRFINGCTDWIEKECADQFASRTGNTVLNTYTREIYDGGHDGASFLTLLHGNVANSTIDPTDPHGSITEFQFRSGSPYQPFWTDFPLTNYELHRQGMTGTVRVYGGLPYGTNNLRITYQAGYAVDWTNEGSSTHTLPSDLTDLCERLVIKRLKRREDYGKASVSSGQGVTTNWRDAIEVEDQAILDHYKRVNFF